MSWSLAKVVCSGAARLFSRGTEELVLESFHLVTTTLSNAWAPPTLALETHLD